MIDYRSAFLDDLMKAFGPLDWLPIPDGAIHRFHVPGDKVGTRNGWYVLFVDAFAHGVFGSWKVGCTQTWRSRKPTSPLEAQLVTQQIERARNLRAIEQQRCRLAAIDRANRLWKQAQSAALDHSYLAHKQVQAYGLRQLGDALLVPLFQDGKLVNLQQIYPDGAKLFLSGGVVKGCYSPLGSIKADHSLYICEGWATGATLHAETGTAVACAMNAGNLLAVGLRLQRRHPDAVLVIAGDDDRQSIGNPGRTAATNAAATLGCGLVFPPWTGDEPLALTDFNDLSNWRAAQ